MRSLYPVLCVLLLTTYIIAEELSSNLETQRVKRVTVEEVDFDNAEIKPVSKSKDRTFLRRQQSDGSNAKAINSSALVLPPYHTDVPFDKTKRSCMLYLEAITILALDRKSIGGLQKAHMLTLNVSQGTYGYDESYVTCVQNDTKGQQPFSFIIDFRPGPSSEKDANINVKTGFKLTLNFIYNSGFQLMNASQEGLSVSLQGDSAFYTGDITLDTVATNTSIASAGMRAYYGYNYACSGTPALLFPAKQGTSGQDVLIGVILNNFQVQAFGMDTDGDKKIPYFGSKTVDCVPTFNQGTWMGIVVTLVLVSVLAFAFLMLNSVQTMDRFDDPKQKQIVINFKE